MKEEQEKKSDKDEKTFKEKIVDSAKKIAPWAVTAISVFVVYKVLSDKGNEIDGSETMNQFLDSDVLEVSGHDNTNAYKTRKYTLPSNSYLVSPCIRKLPEGRHPSPEKVTEMINNGIEPQENITLVDGYIKYKEKEGEKL